MLKSTGGAAGVTADQAKELASALQLTSRFEDEAILSGENLLLTFTSIGKDTFPRATQSMLDMSEALGQDMKASAIQLGKALQEPITGVTALRRVGVALSDEQEELIKTMVGVGDVAGAQAVILAELEKEFGGSAKAASDAAGASEKYKDRMNELSEQIGTKLLPIHEKLNEAKLKLVATIADKVIPALEQLYAKHWPAISEAVGKAAAFIQEHWATISTVFEFVYEFTKAKIEGMIQTFSGMYEIISGIVALVSDLFHGRWREAWEDLKQIASGILDVMIGTIKAMFGSIPGIIVGLAGDAANAAYEFGKRIFDSITNWVGKIPGSIVGLLNDVIGKVERAINAIANSVNSLDVLGVVPDFPTVHLPRLASGTRNWAGGLAVVGERGPELVNLPRGSQVFSNAESRSMGGVVVNMPNATIYARDLPDAERSAGDMAWGLSLALRTRGLAI